MPARPRGALVVAAGIVALGLGVLGGAVSVRGEAAYAGVGPRAAPVMVGIGLTLAGLGFLVSVRRGAAPARAESPPDRTALGWIVASLIAAVLLVEPLGFVPSAALVFAATARGFGSRRVVADVAIGLALGLAVYVVFAHGLGVSLPGGPLDRLR